MIIPYYALFFSAIFIICERTVNGENLPYSFQESDDCHTLSECGKHIEVITRIVGGKETQPHEYPWMVAIFNKGKMHCGGSLINDRYVLTAGHCLKWSKIKNLSVVLGLHDRVLVETEQRGGLSVKIEDIMVHEGFRSLKLHDIEDIGLIKLKDPVKFNEQIKPVCLPIKTDETYAEQIAQVTGWGRTAQKAGPSRYLKEVSVEVISNENCKNTSIIGGHIIDTMLCGYKDEVDACQGDSGGPMIFQTQTGRIEQIGVVSWGIGCAVRGMPGVYTRVTSYLEWIASKTKDAIYCKNPA